MNISQTTVHNIKLTCVVIESQKVLIGAQVAAMLKRETFNMYRSMKIKKIPIRRANAAEVSELVKSGAVRVGTHSVTLVPYEEGLYFIQDAWNRQHECERCACSVSKSGRVQSYLSAKPKIHRRKPLPWNVRRSLSHREFEKLEGQNRVMMDALTSLATPTSPALTRVAPKVPEKRAPVEPILPSFVLEESSPNVSYSQQQMPYMLPSMNACGMGNPRSPSYLVYHMSHNMTA